MSSSSPGFPLEMCLAPLLVLAILAAVYFAARQLKTRAQAELGQMRSDWRRFDIARRQIGETVQAFKDDRNEPFYSRTRDLQTLLDDIDSQAGLLGSRRVELNQRANTLGAAQGLAVMRSLMDWYDLHRQVRNLRHDLETTGQALSAAGEKEGEIRRLGWNIAQQARQAQQLEREVQQVMERLRARKLHGDAFEAAGARLEELRLALEQIPAYFFTASEEDLLAQVDRDAIVFAHTTVEPARPELEAMLSQSQDWEGLFTWASDAAALLGRALDDLDTTLGTIPPGVDLAEARQSVKAMRQIGKTLQSTLDHPEVASLEDLVQEAGRQTSLAQELGHSLKRARREVAALETVLVELPAAFKDLSLQLAALGARSVHPVAWRSSLDTLTELTRKTNALGAANKARLPQQLQADLQSAAELRTRQKKLAEQCRQIGDAHGELLAVLAAPDFARLNDWLDESRRLTEKIGEFAPDNWGRGEAVESLLRDLDGLAASRDRLEISRPAEPLPEDQVLDRLQAVRAFAEEYQRLQSRVSAARTRLDELVQAETTAREQVEAAGVLLGQIDFVVDSNVFLGGIAAQDIERFTGETRRLSADLADRQRGRVDQKARQVEALVERVETSANRWLDQLIRETRQTCDELAGLLRELDEIAQLDEKPVVDARRLLTSGAGLSPGPEPAGRGARSVYPLEEVLPELKRRSDYWHSCNAAVRALEDFHPLIETYQDVMYQRDRAHQALTQAASDVRKKRAWPPTTVTFDAEWQELETIDAQMEELRNNRARAIARTAQLGGIAARYGALAERAAQAAERAARERTDVEENEAQINELAELWRNNLHQYSQYPDVAGEIQALLEDLHHLLAQIRRNYIQGGADYTATLKAIKDLNKRVRYYQVAIDDESALDVQGNVHRRRESRRV